MSTERESIIIQRIESLTRRVEWLAEIVKHKNEQIRILETENAYLRRQLKGC